MLSAWVCFLFLLNAIPVGGLKSRLALRRPVGERHDRPLRDIFLFAGQSNCLGVAQLAELNSEDLEVPSNMLAWPKAKGTAWTSFTRSGTNGMNLPGAFGPEFGFGQEIAKLYEEKNESFGVIKVAKIGTNMWKDWSQQGEVWEAIDDPAQFEQYRNFMFAPPDAKTGPPYLFSILVDSARAAMNSPQCEGGQCRVKALIWAQGEADVTRPPDDAARYGQELSELVSNLREALHSPDMFAVIAEVSPTLNGLPPNVGYEGVAEGEREFVENEGPERAVLVPTGKLTKKDDNMHYDGPGELKLGRKAAKAYMRALGLMH